MNAVSTYESPLGEILLAADEEGLTGLWFRGQKYFAAGLGENTETGRLPVFEETERWLDLYFQGRQPDFLPALHMQGIRSDILLCPTAPPAAWADMEVLPSKAAAFLASAP